MNRYTARLLDIYFFRGPKVEKPALFQVFWATEKEGFNPKDIRTIKLKAGEKHSALGLPGLDSMDRLRIDLLNNRQIVEFGNTKLQQAGYEDISLSPVQLQRSLKARSNLEILGHTEDTTTFKSISKDPILIISLAAARPVKDHVNR